MTTFEVLHKEKCQDSEHRTLLVAGPTSVGLFPTSLSAPLYFNTPLSYLLLLLTSVGRNARSYYPSFEILLKRGTEKQPERLLWKYHLESTIILYIHSGDLTCSIIDRISNADRDAFSEDIDF
jgi:hypothetical protein